METVQLPHNHVLVLEDRTFHRKVLTRLYRNNKFNILINFNFILQPKVGVVNQMNHLCFRRESTIGQLNVETATAEKEKLYILSNKIYIKF